jgi:hypothetical protein
VRRLAALVAASALLAGLFVAAPALVTTTPASAVTGGQFDAGNIIDDEIFFDASTMNDDQIQAFLDGKVARCTSGYTCLEDYRQDTWTRGADPMCAQYDGAANERASTIIGKVARACGVNPQVLVVLLQKEQGLVTRTNPGTYQYRSATGYGCPDTAPCDSEFYGFFNQVYKAAWAFKRYGMPRGTGPGTAWSTVYSRYAAGTTAAVLFHPNSACGTSQVTIANKATAALYFYTPYQPNAAAIAAGYGTGDSCSSYGNRNFSNYFSDWFGPTHGTTLVSAGSGTYLLSAGGKYSVSDVSPFGALGRVQNVSSQLVDAYADLGAASAAVLDTTTGEVSLVAGGARYRFTTCDQVAQWGFSCGSLTRLSTWQVKQFANGGDLGTVVMSPSSANVYLVEGANRYGVATWDSLVRLTGQRDPRIQTVPTVVLRNLTEGKTLVAPGTLAKSPSSDQVFLVDGRNAKLHVSSFDVTVDLGAGMDVATVDQAVLDGYATSGTLSTPAVRCGETQYLGGGGALWPTSGATWGNGRVQLDPSTCAAWPKRAEAVGATTFVTVGQSPVTYAVVDGVRRPVADWTALMAITGDVVPTIVSRVAPSTVSALPVGSTLLGPGTLVKTSGDSRVWFVDGAGSRSWLSTFSAASAIGAGTAVSTVSGADLAAYPDSGQRLTTALVRCDGVPHVGLGGVLRDASQVALGLASLDVSGATCTSLGVGGSAGSTVFVKAASSSRVFLVDGGTKRPVADWNRFVALGGTSITVWGDDLVAALPNGANA